MLVTFDKLLNLSVMSFLQLQWKNLVNKTKILFIYFSQYELGLKNESAMPIKF